MSRYNSNNDRLNDTFFSDISTHLDREDELTSIAVTGEYTVGIDDYFLEVDTSSVASTIYLLDPTKVKKGKVLWISDNVGNSATNNIIISSAGVTLLTISTNYSTALLRNNGTAYVRLI